MRIEICSRAEAAALIEAAQAPASVLSITSTDEADAVLPCNPNVETILRLKLNDLTEAYDEEGIPYGRPLPALSDLSGLKAFVSGLRSECLIVHCWEGVSRSAAVAAAICEARGFRDTLRTRQRFSPNPLIYSLACRALGIAEGDLCYTFDPNDPFRLVKQVR